MFSGFSAASAAYLNGDFNQLESMHTIEQKDHDLSGQYVLVSRNFVYYGRQAINLPPAMDFLKVGRAHRSRFSDDEIHKFIEYHSCPK